MCIIAIVWLLSGIMISRNKDDIFLYVFCFGWGFMDGTVNTHCGQILGFEFETAQDPFSVMMIGQSLAAFVFQLCQGSVKTGVDDGKNLQIYTGCVCIIGLIFVGSTYFFDFKFISGGKQGQ